MNGAKWFKAYAGWWEEEWIIVLSAEAQLAWMKLTERAKTHGLAGRLPKIAPHHLARQWLQGEESVRQMLKAAEVAGKLVDEGSHWAFTEWGSEQGDETGAERKRREREKKRGEDVTDVTRDDCDSVTVTQKEKEKEKEKENPPKSPKGESKDFEGMVCPDVLKPHALRWQKFRREIKKPVTASSWETLFDKYEPMPERFAEAVTFTIEQGWQGLKHPDETEFSTRNPGSARRKYA